MISQPKYKALGERINFYDALMEDRMMKTDEKPYGFGRLKWVSTNWLANHLGDDMIILDVQPDIHDYILTHIPGAVYLAEKTLRVPLKGTPGVILSPDIIGQIFGREGITNKTPVVVYTAKGGFRGWGDGLDQCMMAYTLLRMDHQELYLLDGGLDKWLAEGKETSQKFPDITPKSFKAKLHEDMFIKLDEFMKVKDDPNTILLDARPPKVYTGEAGPWIRNGHIPGAVNLPWARLMTAENKAELKPVDEIKALAEEAGATRDKLVICSCGTGREATNEYTIFKHLLDYPRVRLYEGSFTEWSAHPELEVVKGPNPR